MSGSRLLARSREVAASAYDTARSWSPAARRHERQVDGWSAEALSALGNLESDLHQSPPQARSVLYDGQWENPNYWFRMTLVRAALGLSGAQETGVVGRWRRRRIKRNFKALGINRMADYRALSQVGSEHLRRARSLLAQTSTAGDLMEWDLPLEFPGMLVFDGILKRQRHPTIQLDDPNLVDMVAAAIAAIEAAEIIVGEAEIDLVVLSHALDYEFGALAWAAMRRGAPSLVLYGDFGTSRFIRMDHPEDLVAYPGRPTPEETAAMPLAARESLTEAGGTYLDARLSGGTDDISAIYAFQNRRTETDRNAIAAHYGWDPEKPILAVYGANWFDYPHVTGLIEYRDFLDWIETTLNVAEERSDVNWIFKAHPVDDWYGIPKGTSLDDMTRARGRSHMQPCERSWNGADILSAVDGLVCCHSTAGLEMGAKGKPVLVAHNGWYGEAGFTVTATTKSDYRDKLLGDWWQNWDRETSAERARLFAGWYFAVPEWHGDYLFPDDSKQDSIYSNMPDFIAQHRAALEQEASVIRAWYESGHRFLHIFKMSQAEEFRSVVRTHNATPQAAQ